MGRVGGVQDSHLNLSTDMLMHVARAFMRSMGQPYSSGDIGKSLLTEAQVQSPPHSPLPARSREISERSPDRLCSRSHHRLRRRFCLSHRNLLRSSASVLPGRRGCDQGGLRERR